MKPLAVLAALAAFLLFALGGNAATVNVPCGADLNAAYRAAAPGDVLQLGACSYPNVNFTYDSSKTSLADVVIQGAGIGQTVLGDVDTHGVKHLTLRNLSLRDTFFVPQNGSSGGQRTEDVTLDTVDMYAGGIFLRSCKDCSFLNGASGNRHDAYSQTVGTYSGLPPSQNILIDGWRFHDMDRANAPGGHMECLFIQETDGLVLRNSLFERCAIMDVFASPIVSNSVPSNITVGPGNIFRGPSPERGGGAFLINPDPGTQIVNWTFDGNQWDDRLLIENDGSATLTNVVWCNSNTGSAPALLEPSSGWIVKDCGPPPPPPPAAQCADSVDNDADGKIDLADPGCSDAADDSESPDPPPPPPVAECADGINNDPAEDMLVDLADPGCTDAADNSELGNPPPPPAEYHPACEPTCDEQIASLQASLDAERANSAALQQKIDNAKAALQ